MFSKRGQNKVCPTVKTNFFDRESGMIVYMNITVIKIISLSLLIFLGGALFVYGGYDDSPGAQFLGLIIAIVGTVGVLKRKNKTQRG